MNKTQILQALTVAFRKEFSDGLKHREPTFNKVAMVIPSTTAVNTYAWLSAFPKMREWVGERQIKKLGKQAMSISNKLFESTVSVPRTDIEDDQVGIYRSIMKQAGVAAAELPDDLVWPLLAKGKSTLCYDGQNFFDTEHVWYAETDGTGSPTTMSNLTTGSDTSAPTWYVIDDTNVIMPLVYQERTKPEFEEKFDPAKSDKVFMEDTYLYGIRARGNAGFGLWQLAHMVEKTNLTKESLAKVVKAMKEIKGDGGIPLKINPSLLVVPPALEETAREILEQEFQNGTSNTWKGRLKLHVEYGLS
ncbi:Mu-like prophage major head subunit gpT family protein [Neisseria sp. S1]|uniref:Mu-like prophage major head subunit gpT family protein n=1 Tax=Neisseria sp. S1 TaxID=3318354 RepID=UPI003A8AA6C6